MRLFDAVADTIIRATPKLSDLALNLMGFAGCGSIAYGAWLVYPPAGFITGGVLAVVLSTLGGMAKR